MINKNFPPVIKDGNNILSQHRAFDTEQEMLDYVNQMKLGIKFKIDQIGCVKNIHLKEKSWMLYLFK